MWYEVGINLRTRTGVLLEHLGLILVYIVEHLSSGLRFQIGCGTE
jgi:hypothetical protein